MMSDVSKPSQNKVSSEWLFPSHPSLTPVFFTHAARGFLFCDFRDPSPPCTPTHGYLAEQLLQSWALRPLTGGDAGVQGGTGCKDFPKKGG